MAHVAVQSQPGLKRYPETKPTKKAPIRWNPIRWSPLRWMRGLWDPFVRMAPLLKREPLRFLPDFEIKETNDAYLFKADVPGVKPADLDIAVWGNRLRVSGKREEEKEDKTDSYYACERSYGSFSRSFTLPEGADTNAVKADLSDGVLTLSIARKAGDHPKKIAVETQGAMPH